MKTKNKNSTNKKHHDNYLYRQNLLGYKPVHMMMSIQQKNLIDDIKKLPAGARQKLVNEFLTRVHKEAAEVLQLALMDEEFIKDFQKEFSVSAGDRE
jgi:hypothetical protein